MFGIFRASFDGSLRRSDRRKARASALVVTAAFLALGGAGTVAILHASSDKLNELANAREARELRAPDTKPVASGKPCKDQSWPFIERRCMWAAKGDAETAKTNPAPGRTAAASKDAKSETTGSAAPASTGENKATRTSQPKPAPAPNPTPAAAPAPRVSETVAVAAPAPAVAAPNHAPAQAQPAQKAATQDARRSAKAQARESKARQREARRKREDGRSIMALPEFRPEMRYTPYGSLRRVYVIGGGAAADPYARTMR